MSESLFNISCGPRIIDQANHMIYKTGTVHPARVMQEHDFIYMVDGEWEIIQNDTSYKMQNNDVLILHANEKHSGIVPCRAGTHTMFFHISISTDDRFIKDNESRVETLQNDFISLPTLVSCARFPMIKQRFEDIVAAHCSKIKENYKKYRMSYLFGLLLIELHECLAKTPTTGFAVEEATKLIRSNPYAFFREKELAEKLHICEKSLRQAFKRSYGLTPYKYQIFFKMELACIYLQNHSHMKLSEIANNLGFYDEFHFGRHFKAFYGMSPGEWRRTHS